MQVTVPTTPANFFHLLRRQIKRDFRIPLIVFTPKSLLRHPECTSPLEAFSEGQFMEVFDDPDVQPKDVKQVVCCYGKLYYELLEKRNEINAFDTAIIRIEQLFPFPTKMLTDIISQYSGATRWVWAQEEPENMGAWSFVNRIYKDYNFLPICRHASGSPATGLMEIHKLRQHKILDKVFKLCNCHRLERFCGIECDHFRNNDLIPDNKSNL